MDLLEQVKDFMPLQKTNRVHVDDFYLKQSLSPYSKKRELRVNS